MPLPSAKMKIKKDGITFESNVEAIEYSLDQLKKAALRDTAKFLRKRMIEKFKNLPGMRKSKRLYRSTQYWVRKKETDLQIGLKHNTWYGALSELGDRNQPKRGVVRDTVFENIDKIHEIQSQYLSALSEESPMIPEEQEYKSGDEDE